VEAVTIDPDVDRQQVTFAVKDRKAYSYDEVKKAIESQTTFKVGKVLRGP
jgi:hypothetical protein